MTTKDYLKTAGTIIEKVKPLATEYHQLTGRPLGVTGEIAEYEAIRLLRLQCCVVRQTGYDAIHKIGDSIEKVQIKGRVLHENSKHGQRLGTLSIDKEWDTVLLVLFDAKFSPVAIYKARRNVIIEALIRPGSKARNERGQLSVSQFKKLASIVYPKTKLRNANS